jgi:predicted aspartyl protease
MKNTLIFVLIATLFSCSTNKKLPVLKTTSKIVSIKDGNKFNEGVWTIAPEAKLDEFTVRKFIGKKKVSFMSSIDTLTFNVKPNKIYDFVIQMGEEKALTRINTDTLKQATLSFLEYYNDDKTKTSLTDTIPFVLKDDRRIYLKGKINNSDPLDFLFDTGANAIVITSDLIGNKVNLELDGEVGNEGADGNQTVSTSSSNLLEIEDLNWDGVEIISIDYKNPSFDGVLGWIAFEDKIVEIDYDKNELIIHQSINTVPKGFLKIETKMIRDVPYIKGMITVNGEKSKGWFEYDTGYNGSFKMSQIYASENGLNGVMKKVGNSVSTGSVGIKIKSTNHILPKLQLGKFEINNVQLTITEKDPEGIEHNDILGNNLLKRFNAIIDLKNFEIYLKPNSLFNLEY